MPRPISSVTPGARNFSGASRKEIASTMPSHTKVTATATAVPAVTGAPGPAGGGDRRQVPE